MQAIRKLSSTSFKKDFKRNKKLAQVWYLLISMLEQVLHSIETVV